MLRRLSLTARLTLFFTVLAVAIVLGLGALFMASADRHFVELDAMALQDTQQLIVNLLADSASLDVARTRLSRALDHQHSIRARITDAAGRLVFESAALRASASDESTSMTSADGHAGDRHGIDFALVPAYDPGARLQARVTVDTAFHDEFLHELRRSLAWYALAATLVAGLLGWFAAHQGLAPLRAMKKRAAKVSAQRLESRMPVEAVPVEMADLAGELNRMLERLQDAFRRLSEFSADLAHELRTPISNLLTQTQVTLTTRRDAATYREVLASNAEELERLARMVSDMLFLAKTEQGVDLPNKERFSAATEAGAVVEFFGVVAEEREIRIALDGDGVILGDRLMFRRALGNLLSNALHHAPAQSTVSIQIGAEEGATVVTVENRGARLDPAVLARLFDRFYSTDPARSDAVSGSGLGLAITRAIVEAHAGRVEAQSENDRIRFRLHFPVL